MKKKFPPDTKFGEDYGKETDIGDQRKTCFFRKSCCVGCTSEQNRYDVQVWKTFDKKGQNLIGKSKRGLNEGKRNPKYIKVIW